MKNPQNTLVLEAEIMKIPHNKAIRIGGKGILLYITIQFNSEEEENGGGGEKLVLMITVNLRHVSEASEQLANYILYQVFQPFRSKNSSSCVTARGQIYRKETC